ncbi:hypothetical protein KJ636_00135, partial [Patescibacteria group bacterium]|nr:hypothetical protein [Patescibacteria group bacterium]
KSPSPASQARETKQSALDYRCLAEAGKKTLQASQRSSLEKIPGHSAQRKGRRFLMETLTFLNP